jgi:hypothetical protein
MASIHKIIHVPTAPDHAWEALRDFGAVHHRVATGFVTDTELADDVRTVTFVNGAVAQEQLVSLDDDRRRLVYAVIDSPLRAAHHQAVVEVVPDGDGSIIRWTTDVLPDEIAPVIEGMMDLGADAIARTLAVA